MINKRICGCGGLIPLRICIDGKWRNLQNRSKCLTCLPFGQSLYRKKEPRAKRTNSALKSKRWMAKFKKEHGLDAVCFYRTRRKDAIISLVQSKCQCCGYDKSKRNLVFHHLGDKEHGLSSREFQFSIMKLLKELAKCVLVCHNCHGEIHEGLVSDEQILSWHVIFTTELAKINGMTWDEVFTHVGMPSNDEALGRC